VARGPAPYTEKDNYHQEAIMSYERVIPRDLFNEANLLKCYGRIEINLETAEAHDVELKHDGNAFDIQQDFGSGAIFVANLKLVVRGTVCRLHRPLNSREDWPLYFTGENEEEISVFADDGAFSAEMFAFLKGSFDR
jgi:hypothetical protein